SVNKWFITVQIDHIGAILARFCICACCCYVFFLHSVWIILMNNMIRTLGEVLATTVLFLMTFGTNWNEHMPDLLLFFGTKNLLMLMIALLNIIIIKLDFLICVSPALNYKTFPLDTHYAWLYSSY
ncbi:hypothetical protein ACJX0J_005562, partial [Zea mays]